MKKLLYLICLLSVGQIFSANIPEAEALQGLLMLLEVKPVDSAQTDGGPAAKRQKRASAPFAQPGDHDEEFLCQYCEQDLNSQGALDLHEQRCSQRPDLLKKSTRSKQPPVHYPNNECPYCKKKYKGQSYLRNNHIKECENNPSAERTHACKVGQCEYSGFTKDDLNKHKRECPFVRKDKLTKSMCPDCNRQYADKYGLETHRKKCRENPENWETCYECGKRLRNKKMLFDHFEDCPNQLGQSKAVHSDKKQEQLNKADEKQEQLNEADEKQKQLNEAAKKQKQLKEGNNLIRAGLEQLRLQGFHEVLGPQRHHLMFLQSQQQEAYLQQHQQLQQQLEQTLSQQ